jgi:hypothetical protein
MNAQAGDPFAESRPARCRRRIHVLGSVVEFSSDHPQLMRLVDMAFGGLPRHRLSRRCAPLRVELRLADADTRIPSAGPPPVALGSGAGFLCGAMDAANFAVIAPRSRAALVSASRSMLRHPYHLRYELIEFAVLTLAARANDLVALHAACIGLNGEGALLLGASGAGKSTLCVQSLLQGCDFLSEDSLFVDSRLRATAVPAFLHVRCDAAPRHVPWLRGARVIRRRSGVRKFEIDVRDSQWTIATGALRLRASVLLSPRHTRQGGLLRPLSSAKLLARLQAEQPYAAGLPGWKAFCRRIGALPAFELRRGATPVESAHALRSLLANGTLRGRQS